MKTEKELKELDDIIRAGRTDEQMERDRISAGPPADQMIFSPLGGPYPRRLPDGRVITDPDILLELADYSDEDAMAWLDIPAT